MSECGRRLLANCWPADWPTLNCFHLLTQHSACCLRCVVCARARSSAFHRVCLSLCRSLSLSLPLPLSLSLSVSEAHSLFVEVRIRVLFGVKIYLCGGIAEMKGVTCIGHMRTEKSAARVGVAWSCSSLTFGFAARFYSSPGFGKEWCRCLFHFFFFVFFFFFFFFN